MGPMSDATNVTTPEAVVHGPLRDWGRDPRRNANAPELFRRVCLRLDDLCRTPSRRAESCLAVDGMAGRGVGGSAKTPPGRPSRYRYLPTFDVVREPTARGRAPKRDVRRRPRRQVRPLPPP